MAEDKIVWPIQSREMAEETRPQADQWEPKAQKGQ